MCLWVGFNFQEFSPHHDLPDDLVLFLSLFSWRAMDVTRNSELRAPRYDCAVFDDVRLSGRRTTDEGNLIVKTFPDVVLHDVYFKRSLPL